MTKRPQKTKHLGGRLFLTTTLALLLNVACVFAQGFEISFGGPKEDQGVAILQTEDHGFIQVGFTEGPRGDDNDVDIFVVRTDIDGTLVWSKQIDEGFLEQPTDVIQTENGDYLISGYRVELPGSPEQSYLIKLSPKGDLIWSKTYGTSDNPERYNSIIATDSNEYLLTGTFTNGVTNRQDVLLVKIDTNGNETWRRTFGSSRDEEGIGAVAHANGFVVGANGQSQLIGDNDIKLYGVDTDGIDQWSKTYGSPGTNEQIEDIIPTSDGNLVFVGSTDDFNTALMAKANLNGDTLWYTEVSATPFDNDLRGVIEEKDGTAFVAAGQAVPDNISLNLDILMIKVDASSGQLIYQRLIGSEDVANTAEDLAPTVSGGYAISAYSLLTPTASSNDMTIFKTNREGEHLTNHIRGHVYHSVDGCNPYESNDLGLEGWLVKAESETAVFFSSTDSTGFYDLQIDTGTYTVSLLQKNDRWDICNPVAVVVDFPDIYDSTRQNFSLLPAIDCPLLDVDISAGLPVACESQTITVSYSNQGTVDAEDVSVVIELDEILGYLSSSIPLTNQEEQLLTFDLPNLAPQAKGSFEITVQVACAGIVDRQAVSTSANILPSYNDCAPIDPSWNGSSIEVSSECDGDSIRFIISNPTNNPLPGRLNYIVIEDQVMIRTAPIDALPGIAQLESFGATGNTFRLIAEQVDGHPGNLFPTTVVEGCTANGSNEFSTGQVAQFSDNDGDLNIDILTQEVFVFDQDVNLAMRAYPKGYLDSIITPKTELEYTIIFTPNQTTDTLGRVVIRDTLSDLLDLNSLEMGAASHPYDFTLYQNGVLKITFDSIHLLAGGGTGDADDGSTHKGYVTFRLSQKPNNAVGSIISNRAAVYLDYSTPEISNSVRHIVGCQELFDSNCLLTNTGNYIDNEHVTISVAPNPISTESTIYVENWNGNSDAKFEFILMDLFGREIRRKEFTGDQLQILRRNLPKAAYFYKVFADGFTIGNGKLFVQ